ncbi:FIST signal transduction protein [Thiomicrospira cyclica]|uniref:FIST C domain-containing protein n=1 Tax=Thiomicrospira cyclica (strain DSM 14477 / JCM 11371 / ALM1) TaxID=717773 RepID=F6DBJ3_THICA|nr:FIST N-terminal domain-containing protein [Thiomicrospira cyclica]AEG32395.1 domain of unknown function DUF1745 [Thiomicrospira cyclica ALM1]
MIYHYSSSGKCVDFVAVCEDVMRHEDVQGILALTAEANRYDVKELSQSLSRLQKPIMGGIFPQIVYDSNAIEQGFVLIALKTPIDIKRFEGLSNLEQDFVADIDRAFCDQPPPKSCISLVDGLATCISSWVDGLFEVLGSDVKFVGGGAGSLSFEQRPCLFCNDGVFKDAALIGVLDKSFNVGVGHGWHTMHSGLQVTQVKKNIIYEIDNQNAFEVYQRLVAPHHNIGITAENFFSVAQAYPFGIHRLNDEKIVRDPIAVTPEGGLICVGELSQGDFVDLLTAEPAQLINAAAVTSACASSSQQASLQHPILFDCISRALYLKEQFSDELAAIKSELTSPDPLVGALVLGEIANSGNGYLEFYNKTTVVACFDD